MIVGAGHNQVPYIERAKRLGLLTIAVDGNPEAPGLALADISEIIDIRDAEAMLRTAERLRVDAIYPSAEVGIETAAIVSSRLGLSGISPETARRVRHKGAMRQALDAALIKSNPPFAVVSHLPGALEAAAEIGFPLIVKPADGRASRSVAKVETEEELEVAFRNALDASYSHEVLIERFMEGKEVSVEALVFNGEVIPVAVTGRIVSDPPYRFNLGLYVPADLTPEETKSAEQLTAECLRAVGLTNGLTHTEVLFTQDGPRIVEIAGRLGGGRIATDLVPLAYGVDLATESIKMISTGRKPAVRHQYRRGAALLWFFPPAGQLAKLPSLDAARRMAGVEDIVWHVREGGYLPRAVDCISRDQIGYVIASGSTAEKAIATARKAKELVEESLQVTPADR